jgi:hypothetical protein
MTEEKSSFPRGLAKGRFDVEVYPKTVDIVITSERSLVVDRWRGGMAVSLILRIWCFALLVVVVDLS